jgi:hypothetical protein
LNELKSSEDEQEEVHQESIATLGLGSTHSCSNKGRMNSSCQAIVAAIFQQTVSAFSWQRDALGPKPMMCIIAMVSTNPVLEVNFG